jgi:tetratricopeptide (TPR) repeat protein
MGTQVREMYSAVKKMNARTTDPRGFAGCLLIALLIIPLDNSSQSARDYERGMADFHAGDYSSAAEFFVKVEVASPGATEALLFEGKCLIHLEKYPDAERALRSYVGRHPNSDETLYLLGFVLYRQNRPSESLAMYTKGAALRRPTGDDLKIVGLDYVMLNDYADAVKWLERAVELEPKNKEAWYYLGRAYYTEMSVPDARKAFLTVLDLDPRDAKAENNLGLIFESEARVTEALDAYRQAIAWQQQKPRPSEQPYVNLGNLLMKEGRTEEAIPPLQKAVALATSNAFCHLKLGEGYLRVRRLDEARRELERATQLEPENATAHYQLGRFYQEIHDLARAKAEFDRTMELQSRVNSPTPQPPKE